METMVGQATALLRVAKFGGVLESEDRPDLKFGVLETYGFKSHYPYWQIFGGVVEWQTRLS